MSSNVFIKVSYFSELWDFWFTFMLHEFGGMRLTSGFLFYARVMLREVRIYVELFVNKSLSAPSAILFNAYITPRRLVGFGAIEAPCTFWRGEYYDFKPFMILSIMLIPACSSKLRACSLAFSLFFPKSLPFAESPSFIICSIIRMPFSS
jgi:hypothetical protein